MARLNMPPAPTDNISLERLRRKFAEQNQVLVKSNARQSLQIQRLHGECSRLLSENLDLRGQILNLETQLEESHTRRVADHALEIKSKLEAQFAEMASILATLGVEPPRKRHSPPVLIRRRVARTRVFPSATSPPRSKSRTMPQDSEALAFKEGRLPPIQENKNYPRATLSAEEIMALCEEAEDATDSPDIGPPPVSRYVDVEPVEIPSPSRRTGQEEALTQKPEPPQTHSKQKLETQKRQQKESPLTRDAPITAPLAEARLDKENVPLAPPSAARAGKRKFPDELVPTKTKDALASKGAAAGLSQERTAACETQKPRNIKEFSASRRERSAGLTQAGANRKPLSVKSSNEDLLSPKKAAKAPVPDEISASKARALKEALSRERLSHAKPVHQVPIPEPVPPPVVTILSDNEAPSADPVLIAPDTPDRAAPRDVARDTPPPADISSSGEISRPSRRARAAISYAEPNLRDKMRRPTKELLDAVAGEGKFIHRPSKADDVLGISTPTMDETPSSRTAYTTRPETTGKESPRRISLVSPSAEAARSPDVLPITISTERRKRPSSASRESLAAPERPEASKSISGDKISTSTGIANTAAKTENRSDVYDFSSSSPMAEPRERPEDAEFKLPGASSRNSKKSSTSVNRHTSVETLQASSKQRASGSRKRASMIATERVSMVEPQAGEDSYQSDKDGRAMDALDADKILRRRSMML